MAADRASRRRPPTTACTLQALRQPLAGTTRPHAHARQHTHAICRTGAERTATRRLKHVFATLFLGMLAIGPVHAVNPDAIAAASAASPNAFTGRDTEITTRIQSRLIVRRDIPFTDIDVSTTDGVVRFSGVLDSTAQLRQVVALAKTVRGVRAVDASGLSTLDE